MYMYICVYVYMCICVYVYMCICVYVYVYVYVYLSAQCPLLRKLRCAHLLPRQLVSTLPGFGIPTPGMYLPDQLLAENGELLPMKL